MKVLVTLVVAGALAVPGAGRAGGRPYAFVQGIDTLPDRELELESWFGVFERPAGGPTIWDWWLGPVAGVTDELEAGLFGRFLQVQGGDEPEQLVLDSLRLQLTYAPVPRGTWAVDGRLRLELTQPVADDSHEIWLTLILARQLGRLDLTLNAGLWVELGDETDWWFNYALGASVDVVGGLRLGAELYGDARFEDPDHNHSFGPAAAYGRGRFWISAAWLFGLGAESTDVAARMVLGVLL